MEKVILPESNEAAEKVNMDLWRSRRGGLFLDEIYARCDGATHVKCLYCDAIIQTGRRSCPACLEKSDIARFIAMPEAEWDEKGMIYSQARDRFYASWDEVHDEAYTRDMMIQDFRLIICEPVYLRVITVDDFCDQLPDGGELSDDVHHAIDTFNAFLRSEGPVSWTPGKLRVKI